MSIESRATKIEFSSNAQAKTNKEPGYGIISRGMETIAVATPIEYSPGFKDEYVKAIKEGYYPVVVANHTSQADAIALAKLTYILTGAANDALPKSEQLNGFMLPLSQSLDNGKQGKLKQEFYIKSRPVLAKYHLHPVLTATKNDIATRGLSKNSQSYLSEIVTGMKNNYGIAVLAEGTVTGGKKNESGRLNGMQPLAEDSMAHVVINTKRYKKSPVVFIPVGIDGGYRIYRPGAIMPSKGSILTGLGFGNIKDIASMKVGAPMKSDGAKLGEIIKNKDWAVLENTIGENIAKLLPEELRGVYA